MATQKKTAFAYRHAIIYTVHRPLTLCIISILLKYSLPAAM